MWMRRCFPHSTARTNIISLKWYEEWYWNTPILTELYLLVEKRKVPSFQEKKKNAEVAATAIISNKRKMHLQRPPAILVMSTLHQQIDHENHLTKYVGVRMNRKTRVVAALLGNETHKTEIGGRLARSLFYKVRTDTVDGWQVLSCYVRNKSSRSVTTSSVLFRNNWNLRFCCLVGVPCILTRAEDHRDRRPQ